MVLVDGTCFDCTGVLTAYKGLFMYYIIKKGGGYLKIELQNLFFLAFLAVLKLCLAFQ